MVEADKPSAAGLRYDVNLNAGEGEVIRNVEVKDRDSGSWSPIDPETVYTVSTNSFTAFEDTYITYYVALKEYIVSQPDNTLDPIDPAQYRLNSVNEKRRFAEHAD